MRKPSRQHLADVYDTYGDSHLPVTYCRVAKRCTSSTSALDATVLPASPADTNGQRRLDSLWSGTTAQLEKQQRRVARPASAPLLRQSTNSSSSTCPIPGVQSQRPAYDDGPRLAGGTSLAAINDGRWPVGSWGFVARMVSTCPPRPGGTSPDFAFPTRRASRRLGIRSRYLRRQATGPPRRVEGCAVMSLRQVADLDVTNDTVRERLQQLPPTPSAQGLDIDDLVKDQLEELMASPAARTSDGGNAQHKRATMTELECNAQGTPAELGPDTQLASTGARRLWHDIQDETAPPRAKFDDESQIDYLADGMPKIDWKALESGPTNEPTSTQTDYILGLQKLVRPFLAEDGDDLEGAIDEDVPFVSFVSGGSTKSGRFDSRRSSVAEVSPHVVARDRTRGTLFSPFQCFVASGAHQQESDNLDDIREKRCLSVFRRLQDHGEIHYDQLRKALELLDYAPRDWTWIDTACERITLYKTLNAQEFTAFVKEYEGIESSACEDLFNLHDVDGSGTLDMEELATVLTKFGITPMSQVLGDLILRVSQEREEPRQYIDVEEFKQLLRLLRVSEGFSHGEVEYLNSAFDKFARPVATPEEGTTQLISSRDLRATLSWLCHCVDENVSDADMDGDGFISRTEFLAFMRRVKERELAYVMELVGQPAAHVNDSIVSITEIEPIFTSLGYTPSPEALHEAVADTDAIFASFSMPRYGPQVTLAWLWQCIDIFRKREGLTRKEIAEAQVTFSSFARNPDAMTRLEACRAILYMGHADSWQSRQRLVSEVDVDASGELTFDRFLKLLRKLQERDLIRIKEAFRRYSSRAPPKMPNLMQQRRRRSSIISLENPSPEKIAPLVVIEQGTVKERSGARALQNLGVAFGDATRAVQGKGSMDFNTFARLYFTCAYKIKEAMQHRRGFTTSQARELRQVFDKYDKDGNGDLENLEVRCLLEDWLPEMATKKDKRPELVALLKTIDENGDGMLNFGDFIHFAAKLRELRENAMDASERWASNEARFSPIEFDSLRELFLSSGGSTESARGDILGNLLGADGTLSFQEVETVLCGACKMTSMKRQALSDAFRESIQEEQFRGPAGANSLTRRGCILRSTTEPSLSSLESSHVSSRELRTNFPSFLLLMRRVVDMNLPGSGSSTSGDSSASASAAGDETASNSGGVAPPVAPVRRTSHVTAYRRQSKTVHF